MICWLDFFGKKGVCVLSLRQLFDFVTDPNITDDNIDLYLDKVFLSVLSTGGIF